MGANVKGLISRFIQLWRPETGVFLALWLLLLVGGRGRLFRDPGTFWHTRLGQQMLATGQLVRGDSFSFTLAGLPAGKNWIPHQWLGECLMASLYQWKEWDGLLLGTVTVLACLYTWLAHRLMQRGMHWSLAIVVAALALAAGSNHFHVRPHLATLVFFAVTCAFLYDLDSGRKQLRHMIWLVPAYALWANMHGGFLGGIFSLGLVWAGWTGLWLLGHKTLSPWGRGAGVRGQSRLHDRANPSPPTPPPQGGRGGLARFAVLIAACTATVLLNPYGGRLPATWLEIMQSPHLGEIIQEHARLNPLQPEGIAVLVFGAAYVVLLAGVQPWQFKVTWLLPLVWFALACLRVRHAPLFGLAAGLAIGEVFPQTIWARRIVEQGGDLFVPPEKFPPRRLGFGWLAIPLAFLTSCIMLRADVIPSPLGKAAWTALDGRIWPLSLVEHLRAEPAGTKLFNELNLGGFVIFYAPQLKVFIDDRCELYGDDFLQQYDVAARLAPERVLKWRERYGFDLALTLTGSAFDGYLRDPNNHWSLVASSEAASLFRYQIKSGTLPVGEPK